MNILKNLKKTISTSLILAILSGSLSPASVKAFAEESIGNVLINCGFSDERSFMHARIPTLVLTGFDCSSVQFLHNKNDNIDNFDSRTLQQDFEKAYRTLLRVDREWHRPPHLQE